MGRETLERVAFNRGLVSPLALARVDLKRMAFSCETMTNWMPRSLGSMMLRPGLGYIGATRSNLASRYLPFVFATDDTALLEFTNLNLRIWINDVVLTRGSVSSAVTNGNFDTDLTGWTDNDESGATSAWVTGGYMGLTGTGTNAAIRDQQVTVAAGDQNDEHALRIVIERGPVTLRVGSTSGDDDYIEETDLLEGTHSLAFTPTGDFHIRFMSRLERIVRVNSCNVEAAGVVEITSPFTAANLGKIRGGPESQSGDVVFLACQGYQQRRVERRATRSWSLVLYQTNDGPFRGENVGPITIDPSGLTGNITLTASAPLFASGHAGSVWRITSDGQLTSDSFTGAAQWSNAIRVTGVDSSRIFGIAISGTWSATITLQRSLTSDAGPWEDVTTYTSNTVLGYDDGLDNIIVWYRIGIDTGDYTSGTAVVVVNYKLGSIDGVVRITGVSTSTLALAEVLSDLGGVVATEYWSEGLWSDFRGWPSSVGFYEGRLAWAGKDGVQASVSDAFDSFDPDYEGDAGPIIRSIGSGPVDVINWILPLQRLMLGGQGAEHSCRSTAFDEPLTPTNFNIKPASTQGSAAVQAVKVDSRGVYVQRGGTRVYELTFNPEIYDYSSVDLSVLVPEIGQPSIVRMAVQRQPDTRIHFVRSDGTVAVLVYDRTENVNCWLEIETDGLVEDAVVLPGASGSAEDQVYYAVRRTINGSTVRYLEKWALESECVGGTTNKQADAFVTFTNGSPSTTVSGLTHLVGEDVVVWQDGVCPKNTNLTPKTYTVSGAGTITLDAAATTGMVGLAYTGSWQSAKLGRALTRHKKINGLGLVLYYTHPLGLKHGPTLTDSEMDWLPLMHEGTAVDQDDIYESFDEEPVEFPGGWSTDSRLCMKAYAPRPATVLAAIIDGEAYS